MSDKFWTPERVADLRKLVAEGLTAREVAEKFGVTRKAVIGATWRNGIHGWNRADPKTVPADFVERYETARFAELARHYGVSVTTIKRWQSLKGLKRGTGYWTREKADTVRSAPKSKAGPVDRPHMDHSQAGLAASFLRRDRWIVFRCNADGRAVDTLRGNGKPNPDASHWRCGTAVCTDDELIARAKRRGWNPDAWQQVAA